MLKKTTVIFLLNIVLGCNLIFSQQPLNDLCSDAQTLCDSVWTSGSTKFATIDTCSNCSDNYLFNPATPFATIWYSFNTNTIGDSLKITLDITSIPFGIEVGGVLQLRLVKTNNSCFWQDFEPVGSSFSSTSLDTAFIFTQLSPNTNYGIILNENSFGVLDPGIEFNIMISGKSVELPNPTGAIIYEDTLCQNEVGTYFLEVNDCPSIGLVSWFRNDQLLSSSGGTILETNEVENGDIIRAEFSCFQTCSEPILISTDPIYVHTFQVFAGNDTIINPGDIIQLHAITDVSTYYWDTQLFISSQSSLEPFVFPEQTFTYPFVAFDQGCSMYDYVTVFVRNGLEIPNTFSPNGDNTNDSWKIPDIELYPQNELVILNRHGAVLENYFPYSPSNQWTGTWQGMPLPEGAYFYILKLNDKEQTIYKGTISIIR